MSIEHPTDEERDVAYKKARETLGSIGWVFDAYVKIQMGKILDSDAGVPQEREDAYSRARVAMELKGALVDQVKTYEDTLKVRNRFSRQGADDGGRTGERQH